ncbi:transposable element Tcb2 transposase [Trichonephila clavipes]|nr:transposable element Tcb2 transposase [Trichonephila clavipes]
MIIDTGANVSIIRNDLAQKKIKRETYLDPAPRGCYKTVTGEKIDIHGKLKVKIQFGDTTYQHAVYVSDIADPFILGLDFLKEHGFTLDFNKNELRSIHEEVTIFKIEHRAESIRQVTANENITIPPRTEIIVPGYIGNDVSFNSGLIGSAENKANGLLIASTLVDLSRKTIPTARGGRVRSTTPAEDRYIVLSAKRNRRTTAQQVANQFLAASGKQISRKTVARRLRGGGLYARRPVVCVPLTRQHRTARFQWCREHHNWTEQDWACVLFSEESRFSLSSDCTRQLIWRESGTVYHPENIQEKDRYPTCSIMVWAGIMINGRTRLHVVANGTMTGQRYIDEVLLPHVRLFRGAVGDKFVFMDDNATCHRTLAVQDCLDGEGIQRLVWPARFPDLNPIENMSDVLGRQVAGRNYPPTNKNTLIRALRGMG